MRLQNDISEIKMTIVEYHSRQMRLVENSVANGSAGWLPTGISCGYAILVDATGREHTMLLDQCRYFDVRIHNISIYVSTKFNRLFQQLDAMLPVMLSQCRPDEAEIQRWYIERKEYDFVVYNKTNSDVIWLTRESDIWSNMTSGARIVMRVITEEEEVGRRFYCDCDIQVPLRNIEYHHCHHYRHRGCIPTGQWLHRRMVSFPLLLLDGAYNELKVGDVSDGSKSHLPERNET